MKIAHLELQRALQTLNSLKGHVEAVDHTLSELMDQVASARSDVAVMRLDLEELRSELTATVKRVEALLAKEEG